MFTKGYMQDKQLAITYAGMLWLLAAQLIVMLPLSVHLPIWLIPILIISAGWRLRVMQGRMEQPGNLGKLVIGVLGIGALFASGLDRVSLDLMASLLMLGFAYKSLEVIKRRDGMVVVLTGYILVAVQFLYAQSMLTAVYGAISLVILTGAMIAMQQSRSVAVMPNLRLAGVMLLLCLPLMITLFVFTPRFSPLWGFSLAAGHAKTGITDRMTPGDIASLSQSDDLAFRVTFDGERPAQDELYWRGVVLNHFDGESWTQFAEELEPDLVKSTLRTNEYAIKKRLVKKGYGRHYEVIYERSAQSWLFALSPVVELEGDAIFGNDFRIMARKNVVEPLLVKILSYPQALRDVQISKWDQKRSLQLPAQGNSQTQALVESLLTSSKSKEEYIQKVLNLYREDDFYYTLRPPTLSSNNSIDDFLFSSKRGFCAHYAGSFVYMMRAAGIPARVIAGYQGGEWNEKSEYLAVHQYDAHAWTEVWLADKGWVRFDPTMMVAPQRVEQNLETAVSEEGSFLEGQLLSTTKYPWLDNIRKRVDSSQYAWRKFVLGYDEGSQSQLMQRLFGEVSALKIATIVGVIVVGIIAFWFIFLGLAKKRPREAREHILYRQFCEILEKYGASRELSQPPMEYSNWAASQIPELSKEIQQFSNLYSTLCYAPAGQADQQDVIRDMQVLLKTIKSSKIKPNAYN